MNSATPSKRLDSDTDKAVSATLQQRSGASLERLMVPAKIKSTSLELSADGLVVAPKLLEDRVVRFLLVDDEPRMLTSLCELLRDRDYELVTASSGREALEHISSTEFDLVLLDLRLPDFGGLEIMDRLRQQNSGARIIVISGETGIDSAIASLKHGAHDYLRKPYRHDELLRAVDNLLKQRELEAAHRRVAWQLECSENLYRYLIDSSPDIVYTLNEEGRFSFINDRVRQLLGFTSDELIGKHYTTVVHDDDLERAYYVFNERRVGERATRNVELRLKSLVHGGSDRTFDNTLMTMSFNSLGMYAVDAGFRKQEFYGTYGVARDITDKKRAEEIISHYAYHDTLTDLPNRLLFKDRLSLAMIHAKRNATELAVLFLDLDRFKLVNDTLGHLKGDDLLQQVSGRLKEVLRSGDTLARLGGDEFTIFLPQMQSREDVGVVASKILKSLQQVFVLEGHEVFISASIGIAVFPGDGETVDDLLRHADIAMYQIKGDGKNGYCFYDAQMLDASHQKITVEHSLRRALDQGELEVYYQPQIDVMSSDIIGVEALIRWNHPERGLLTAGEFIPFAEENGLIIPISDWMLDTVCRDLVLWKAVVEATLRVAINLSPHYLERGDFVEKLGVALEEFAIAPSQIEVEITENICIRNPQRAIEQLKKLCDLGVWVAVDDFGTGYSSLSYLHRFPVHCIKIDQSFVNEVVSEKGHYPIILAIIAIAKGLNLKLVAEGVETQIQANYLQLSGCVTMQGFLYYRPMTQHQFLCVLQEKKVLGTAQKSQTRDTLV